MKLTDILSIRISENWNKLQYKDWITNKCELSSEIELINKGELANKNGSTLKGGLAYKLRFPKKGGFDKKEYILSSTLGRTNLFFFRPMSKDST